MNSKHSGSLLKLLVCLVSMTCVMVFADVIEVKGTVNTDLLNVRAKAGRNYTPICQIKKGYQVTILGKEKTWYKIMAPETAAAWVTDGSVKEGKASKSTNVYSGPGIGYTPVAKLKTGTPVKVLDSSRQGWIKIAPTKNTFGWVVSQYIDVAETDKNNIGKEVVKKATPAKTATPAAKQETAAKAASVKKDMPAKEAKKQPAKAAEAKKAEPKKAVAEKAEPKKVEPKKAVAEKAEPKKVEPKKVEAKKASAETKALVTVKDNADNAEYEDDDDDDNEEEQAPDFQLTYIRGTSKPVQKSGYALPLINPVYVTNALGRKKSKRILPYCYIHCTGFSFDQLQYKQQKFTVVGIEKKVKGWKMPMIEVEKVIVDGKTVYTVPKQDRKSKKK